MPTRQRNSHASFVQLFSDSHSGFFGCGIDNQPSPDLARAAYDAVKDFTPVAHLADAASVLLVTPWLPVKTIAELIDYAKKRPGQLNHASSGNCTIVHLSTEAFKA